MTELTDREYDDIKEALRRIETKLDILIPTQSAHEERIKNLERLTNWQWGVIGSVVVGLLVQYLHML